MEPVGASAAAHESLLRAARGEPGQVLETAGHLPADWTLLWPRPQLFCTGCSSQSAGPHLCQVRVAALLHRKRLHFIMDKFLPGSGLVTTYGGRVLLIHYYL